MRVDNRNAVRRLSFRSLKASRKRNIIAIIAIALTTVMFTVLFTMAMSIISTYELSMFKRAGGYCHGTFKEITEEQAEKISAHKLIKETGERITIGRISEGHFSDTGAEISFMDANCSKWSFAEPTTGRIAQSGNEITMDTAALEKLGVKAQPGEKVRLTFVTSGLLSDETEITDEFTLVGFWEYDAALPVHYINVSRDYVEALNERFANEASFRIDLNVMLGSSYNIEQKLLRVDYDLGYNPDSRDDENSARIGVNWGYVSSQLSSSIDTDSIIGVAAIIVLIVLTGYLIIYNIFRISVAGDIRFYGLLKTIGTTPRQIRRIIRNQALTLCVAAIPAGLAVGYLAGRLLAPVTLLTTSFDKNSFTISSSPLIFLSAAAFSLITVWISCNKPGRTAGKVSPVEAVKYTEADRIAKKKQKTRGAGPFRMAVANLGRSRSRTALVLISLSLSVVILSLLVSFTSGFDLEKYVSRVSEVDFVAGDKGYFNSLVFGDPQKSEHVLKEISERFADNVGGGGYETPGTVMEAMPYERWLAARETMYQGEEIEQAKIENAEDDGTYRDMVLVEGLDEGLFGMIEVYKGDIQPLFDREAHGIAAVVSLDDYGNVYDEECMPGIGDRVRLMYADGQQLVSRRTGKPLEFKDGVLTVEDSDDYNNLAMMPLNPTEAVYTVTALVKVPRSIGYRYSYGTACYVLPKDIMEADSGRDLSMMFYAFNAKDAATKAEAEEYLNSLTAEGTSSIRYESTLQTEKEFGQFRDMFLIVGGAVCFIIGLIGALNFVNTIMTGVIARQKELAVLRAVGMTGKQLKKMLIFEGMLYTVGSGVISTVLVLVTLPFVGTMFENMFWFYSRKYVIWPVAVMLPVFAALGILVSGILYRRINRQNVVESLRAAE